MGNIDFNGVEIIETEDGFTGIFSADLEKKGAGEEVDRFQYEIMKRAGLDVKLENAGIEIRSFEEFQELHEDEKIEISLVCIIRESENGKNNKLTACAYYGDFCENSTEYSDIQLNDAEQKQFNELCFPAIEEKYTQAENIIDFNKVEISDSDYGFGLYSAALEKSFDTDNSEANDRFKYNIMKRAEINTDLEDVGIKINSFEDFMKFREDDSIQLDIILNCVSEKDGDFGLVANALYGEKSTDFSDVPLKHSEQKQFEELCLPAIEKDKKSMQEEYEMN